MRKTRRTSRVGETVRDALVEVFRHDLHDQRLVMASITGVDVSPDLHFARVFISGLKEDETREIVKELHKIRSTVRHHLARKISLRYTPELDFQFDDTSARAGRIEDLLKEVKTEDKGDDDKH